MDYGNNSTFSVRQFPSDRNSLQSRRLGEGPQKTVRCLGIIDPVETAWQSTNQSAIDQDLIRLTYISNGLISSIKSRLLVRRLWQIDGELPVEEKPIVVYPSANRILLALPVLPDYIESGLATYKIQAKRYYRFRRAIRRLRNPDRALLVGHARHRGLVFSHFS